MYVEKNIVAALSLGMTTGANVIFSTTCAPLSEKSIIFATGLECSVVSFGKRSTEEQKNER